MAKEPEKENASGIISDVLSPLKDVVSRRMLSPLTSTFVISWCIWNYKLILIILSDNEVSVIFKLIEDQFTGIPSALLHLGAFPLVSSLVYLFGFTSIANLIDQKYEKQQTTHRNEMNKNRGEELISLDESRLIKGENIRLKNKNFELSVEYEKKISELERIISTQATQIDSSKVDITKIPDQKSAKKNIFLEPEEQLLLEQFRDGFPKTRHLISATGLSELELKFFLERLEEHKLLENKFLPEIGDEAYTLTQSGREFLIKNPPSPA